MRRLHVAVWRRGLELANLKQPEEHTILPEVISKEPFTPAVAEGDAKWLDVVNWTIFTLFIAEEKGITAANVDEVRKSTQDPEVKRLLGDSGSIGVDSGWTTSGPSGSSSPAETTARFSTGNRQEWRPQAGSRSKRTME